MEKSEKIKIGVICATILLCTVFSVYTYNSIEQQKNAAAAQQQFSVAVQSISNVKPEMQSVYIISLGTYGKPAIPVLLRLMAAPADSPAQAGAGIALQVMGEQALTEVTKAAVDDSLLTDYRKSAITALGKFGGQKAKDVLLKIAQNPHEINVLRNQALKSLLSYSTIENFEEIWKLLETEDHSSGFLYQSIFDVLFDIAARISAIKAPEVPSSMKNLIREGLSSKKNDVRFFAVRFTGILKDQQGLQQLEKISTDDSVEYVKKEAADILAVVKGRPTELKKK